MFTLQGSVSLLSSDLCHNDEPFIMSYVVIRFFALDDTEDQHQFRKKGSLCRGKWKTEFSGVGSRKTFYYVSILCIQLLTSDQTVTHSEVCLLSNHRLFSIDLLRIWFNPQGKRQKSCLNIKKKCKIFFLGCMTIKVLVCSCLFGWKEIWFLYGYVWERRGEGERKVESLSVT